MKTLYGGSQRTGFEQVLLGFVDWELNDLQDLQIVWTTGT